MNPIFSIFGIEQCDKKRTFTIRVDKELWTLGRQKKTATAIRPFSFRKKTDINVERKKKLPRSNLSRSTDFLENLSEFQISIRLINQ